MLCRVEVGWQFSCLKCFDTLRESRDTVMSTSFVQAWFCQISLLKPRFDTCVARHSDGSSAFSHASSRSVGIDSDEWERHVCVAL
jgi:hypothetical protein